MTAKNLKPEDAKALQAAEAEPNFEDLEFSASTEVRELPQEMKPASIPQAAPQNVVPINKPAAPAQQPQVQARPQVQAQPQAQARPVAPAAPLPTNVLELQFKMKEMEKSHRVELEHLDQVVTELLMQIKTKSQMIDQDVMRIKKLLEAAKLKK